MGDNQTVIKQRISDQAKLAEARRLIEETADRRAELGAGNNEPRGEASAPVEHARPNTGDRLTPPERS